jgi:hypothetical protein
MTSGPRIADNVPIGTWVFIDICPKSKPPKAEPRFHGPFIIVKNLNKGAVIVRLQYGSDEIINLDRCHTLTGQPMIEWTKEFVQSEKKDLGKSTALVPATKTQVTDEESQVSQIGSVVEEPQIVRMEEEESDISLFSDTVTQDIEMSEPVDFFVWIKNLDSHMENRERFLRGLRNPFGKVLLIQIFQEIEIVFGAINTTGERFEVVSNELNRKILLGRPIAMTFKRGRDWSDKG